MAFLDLLTKPHLVKNVPGTEWPAYKRWQETEAFLSYLILPFPSHPGDQEKLLSVERGRCKEEIRSLIGSHEIPGIPPLQLSQEWVNLW